MSSEIVSLLTSDDEGEVDAAAAVAAPSRQPRKKRRRGGWRRRAGDPSSTSADAEAPPPREEIAAEAASLERALSADALRAALLDFGLKPGGRAKAAMALRLVRARHAAAASEALYAATASGSSSAQLPPRFDAQRAGQVSGSLEACRLCAGAIVPPRRTFCSDECVHFHLLRTSGSHVRKALALRDGKRCVQCGVDAGAAYRSAQKAVREAAALGDDGPTAEDALASSVAGGPFEGVARLRSTAGRRGGGRSGRSGGRSGRRRSGGRAPRVQEGSFWQADHLVAVHEGGGCCGIGNLRTLCSPCHAKVTKAQAKRRADERRRRAAMGGEADGGDAGGGDGGCDDGTSDDEDGSSGDGSDVDDGSGGDDGSDDDEDGPTQHQSKRPREVVQVESSDGEVVD